MLINCLGFYFLSVGSTTLVPLLPAWQNPRRISSKPSDAAVALRERQPALPTAIKNMHQQSVYWRDIQPESVRA